MKKYVIERDIPGIGAASRAEMAAAARTSCNAIEKINNRVQWVESFVTADKTFCIYLAESTAAIEDHARISGFPANRIYEVNAMIDPTTGQSEA